MTGDYLWDRSGVPDPDVVRLERVMGLLREPDHRSGPLVFPAFVAARRRSTRSIATVMALAAAVIALIAVPWRGAGPLPGLEVTRLEGTPTIGSRPVADRLDLNAGHWLETNDRARASIDIAGVGRVEVEPGTRIGLVSTRPGLHRLQLSRGTMHAVIWAPPGQFAVNTPSSTAVDLGCAYTLRVDEYGVGHIQVMTGWVGFEWRGRESFIPAGAVCRTRPARGPGTPYFDDASVVFKAALETLDLQAGTAAARRAALDAVLAEARERDAVTLWHLISRVDQSERGRVFDRLVEFAPPPAGVTRDGALAGERQMLDDWWDTLGLGAANWWRVWKQQWREK